VPRYYFHLVDDLDVADQQGQELPDPTAAREVAIKGAREVACAALMEGGINLEYYIKVTDEGGAEVLTLPFREAFTVTG
jgi:hypothetical protein